MSTHYTNELICDLPQNMFDATHHMFRVSEDGPSDFNIVISRSKAEKDDCLEDFGSKLIEEMKKTLPKCIINSNGNMKVADQDAFWFICSTVYEGRRIFQAHVIFFHNKENGVREAIQVSATSLGKFSAEGKQTFENFLASIKFRSKEIDNAISSKNR